MTTQNLTHWFPPHTKPVRVGVYQTETGYSLWDGTGWRYEFAKIEDAEQSFFQSCWQYRAWRGLTKEVV